MVIVFKNPDGSCGIITPALDAGMTVEEIAAKDVPAGRSWRITAKTNLPTDRTYRDAWTDSFATETVDVHLPTAKKLHIEKLKAARNLKFKEFNLEELKGVDVAAEKQALRSLAAPTLAAINAATTPAEITAIWPSELALKPDLVGML